MKTNIRVLGLGFSLIVSAVFVPGARGEVQAGLAYATPEGVVMVDYDNRITVTKDGGAPRLVGENIPGRVFLAGRRLVIVGDDRMFVFEPDSWEPRMTPINTWIETVAGSADTTIAFDRDGVVWRLGKDGTWSQRGSGIKDQVLDVTHYRGLWVVVGATRSVELSEDEVGPGSYGQPRWVQEQNEPRMWWSTDGNTWQPGTLPDLGYNKLLAVAGASNGWVAAAVDGTMLVSKDGRTWENAGAPDRRELEEGVQVVALGGSFWMRVGTGDWSRSADGRSWAPLPTFAGARRDALFMKDGRVYAAGLRQAGRGLEIAAVEDFASAPPLNAAELAAKAAAEERARLAAEAKEEEERKAALAKARAEKEAAKAKALAAQQAAEAKAAAEKQALEEMIKPLVVALETFDHDIGAAPDFGRMGEPMAKLVKALDAHGRTRLADAVAETSVDYLLRLGGVRGVFDYTMTVPDHRLRAVMGRLTPAQRELLKPLSAARIATIYKRQADWQAVNEAEVQWPASSRNKDTKGPPAKNWTLVDLARLRRAVARGNEGATFDLCATYAGGQGVPSDRVLAAFWKSIFVKLYPGMPDEAKDPKATAAFMIRAGSPYYQSIAVQDTLKANGYTFTDELLATLEQAFADGDNYAGIVLQDNQETLALRKKGLTFEQIYAAYPNRKQDHTALVAKAKAMGLNERQITITLDRSTAYMAKGMTMNTSEISASAVGKALTDYNKAAAAEREKMYADLAARKAAEKTAKEPRSR